MARKLKSCTTRSTSSKRPSFFKVMVGDHFDEKLRVPTAFIRHFNVKLPHKSILRSPTGRSWPIRVKKVGNDLFFSDGWQAFVNDHCLEFGDFLVFKYNGKSKFSVKIYGRSGCEKEVHLNHEEPMSNVKKEKEDQKIGEGLLHTGGNPEPGKPAMEIEKKAGAAVTASSIKIERPHFIATWRHSRKYHLTIPKALAKENDLKTKDNIVLQDPEGRSWPVVISRRPDGRFDMTNGWPKFWRANKLAVGDTCLFEFLHRQRGDKVMSVRIFRKAEVEKPARLLLIKRSNSTATLNLLTCDDDSTEQFKAAPVSCSVIPTAVLPKTAYVTTHAEERAIKAASTFESENPFCMIIMRPSYVHNPYLVNVPSEFAKAYLMLEKQIATLRVSDGRMWQVRCRSSEYHTKLTGGWKDFVSDNHLKEGDVCVFELVNRKNFKMNVFIFRVLQDVV